MAVRYRFTKDFDFAVNSYTDVGYKAGSEVLIPEAHAAAADYAKAGERVPDEKPAAGKKADAKLG